MDDGQVSIFIAGSGGQGVVVVGNLIARACVMENKNVCGMVAYGAEMRGGTAFATVIVSQQEIACPYVDRPHMAIILNQPSLEKFEKDVVAGGLMLVNTSTVQRPVQRRDVHQLLVAANDLAYQLGSLKSANIVALGAFVAHTRIVAMEDVRQAVRDLFGSKNPKAIDINLKALQVGSENFQYIAAQS